MEEILKTIGFKPAGVKDEYRISINDYGINVKKVSRNWLVDYGEKIKVHHSGVCTLSRDEYSVQLECVVYLLKKGYKPEAIELEKTFKLGHSDSGRLDVLVKDANNISWGMIEVKTFGKEFDKAKKDTLKDGAQIFSYFAQDRNVQVLSLYASVIENKEISRSYFDVVTEGLTTFGSVMDIFSSWNRSTSDQIIFNDLSTPYELTRRNLRKSDLIDLTKESGKSLFNKFAELLRRYVISDKSNAFNVIFNVFVCKIFDEDMKKENQELDVQVKFGDTHADLLQRLSVIYQKSVTNYLSLSIDDAYFVIIEGKKIALREFSFIEVLNRQSFEQNTQILFDLVSILQRYRIKYSTRHQFLGDFFENLLTTGVKQESGQFFTPVPLARFVLRSLPIEDIIQEKISAGESYILPYVIDYACGSGHFLTEAIEEIQSCFDMISDDDLNGQQERFYKQTRDNYLWARDYVYGIEKDYRLAKTSKIAMFMNGDGDATIINADGLADFFSCENYKGLLRSNSQTRAIDVTVQVPLARQPPSRVIWRNA